MTQTEKVIECFEKLREYTDREVHPVVSPDNWNIYSELRDLIDKAEKDTLALLKVRVMTLEEIKDYLNDPDGDKKPLWLEWHTIPALSGWVLASQVSDLMKRYMDSYNNTWRPWISRPTDEQREATPWERLN